MLDASYFFSKANHKVLMSIIAPQRAIHKPIQMNIIISMDRFHIIPTIPLLMEKILKAIQIILRIKIMTRISQRFRNRTKRILIMFPHKKDMSKHLAENFHQIIIRLKLLKIVLLIKIMIK